jgi:hypothetical protein
MAALLQLPEQVLQTLGIPRGPKPLGLYSTVDAIVLLQHRACPDRRRGEPGDGSPLQVFLPAFELDCCPLRRLHRTFKKTSTM